MNALRQLFHCRRALAAWIVASALLMKIVVPAGFMPVFTGDGVTIALCTGVGPQSMSMAMPDMADHGKTKGDHAGKETPCGFGGLAFPSLAGADPLFLALAIAFIVTTAFRIEMRSAASPVEHLRPPSRGPPTIA